MNKIGKEIEIIDIQQSISYPSFGERTEFLLAFGRSTGC